MPEWVTAALARPAVEPALVEAHTKGVLIVRSSRVGNGIVARNGEAKDDELTSSSQIRSTLRRHVSC